MLRLQKRCVISEIPCMKRVRQPMDQSFNISQKHSLSSRKDLGDYIAKPETYFNRLDIVDMPVAEETQVAIFLVS